MHWKTISHTIYRIEASTIASICSDYSFIFMEGSFIIKAALVRMMTLMLLVRMLRRRQLHHHHYYYYQHQPQLRCYSFPISLITINILLQRCNTVPLDASTFDQSYTYSCICYCCISYVPHMYYTRATLIGLPSDMLQRSLIIISSLIIITILST